MTDKDKAILDEINKAMDLCRAAKYAISFPEDRDEVDVSSTLNDASIIIANASQEAACLF